MQPPSSPDATSKPPPPAATSAPAKRTLLIVDDEVGPRESLRQVFKYEFDLLVASSGPEAIELAKQHRVDVVISDIKMAGMSGVELLGHLKAVDPGIEVIMVTAYETTETLRQALRQGACDYLNKPFDVASLRKAVANALERRALGDELRNNARALQELQQELQNQKMAEEITRTKSDIYASIIHDINSPLTVISGFIQLMNQQIGGLTRVEGKDLEFIKEKLKTITRQVTNCIEISRRYLSFLRQDAPGQHSVKVNHVLADLNDLLRVHPSAKCHEFSIEPLPEDVVVRINGIDLIQILLNLAVNGFQCSPEKHSVEIRGARVLEPLELERIADGPEERFVNRDGFSNKGPLLSLSVKDTGAGIPAEILPRIFDAYFTTKPLNQGTGLGLNLVQRFIKEARVGLHVRTRVGHGTTFTLYLPIG